MANRGEIQVNDIYDPLFFNDSRYYVIMGGRAGGRSFVASQYALTRLVGKGYFRCAIMRYVLGDIRNSIYQEILDRIEESGVHEDVEIKENSLLLKTNWGNKINGIGFRKSSSDQKSKLKSLANYNCVIIEEADEVAEEDFMQLDDSLRTIKSDIKVILLFNPPHKDHWLVRRFFNLKPSGVDGFYVAELKKSLAHNTTYIHTTYKNNIENLNSSTITNFLTYKETRPDHYYSMIEGYVSEGARGRIYKDWQAISKQEYDQIGEVEYYGLDFGFSNDPTSLVAIKEHNNRVYVDELIYETGLVNRDPERKKKSISEKLRTLGIDRGAIIYADSAEPKSIEELNMDNWNVVPAEKGQGSVNAGIDMLLSKEVYYTERSTNIAREIGEYRWALNRNKEPTNKPMEGYDHAMDAIRYGVYSNNKKPFVGFA